MNRFKKLTIVIIGLLVIGGIGWLSFGPKSGNQSEKVVKVGLMTGSKADDEIWQSVAKTAHEKYHIKLQFVHFTDYTQPNTALAQHSIDINSFQHYAFLKDWNDKHKTDITSIGDTVITPIRLYSNKYRDVKEIPDGAQITIPNDATNESRALIVLKDAGLIKLDAGSKGLLTVKDITANRKNLDIKEVDASQTARSLNDVAAAIVNTNYAQTANLDIKKSIFVEPANKESRPWVNLIAANKADKNKKELKQVVKAFQTRKTERLINQHYGKLELSAWNRKFN
ncbi:Methionine ABC transporter substrate-binding protein [Fructilactobacillus florum 8D]|uniref:Lipoprotein n=1 Tax=Fructilactobacillus florum 8D TaxID=1221538 RepID=W9EJ73_9LACO|nr:MetQ/NlpA family ABC transporter substrate-binding protein [Fructilactobacillus florum]EKK21064.1 Methionine ABC transporter substrate-binding protein [Fructilactobacillus florum 2F]ETO41030.1 Methionine ABC transporter substrate-binding protein [Fructilactobacillus florum 8D]